MKKCVWLFLIIFTQSFFTFADELPEIPMPKGFEEMGAIQSRSSKQIKRSNWSVGAETMGRDFTIYRYWREYLGPLGVKSARIQSGWAKTEKTRGEYNWAWLDEIIPDMIEQGVKPWVCLCYGNPIYPGGGTAAVSSRLPASPEALQGWDNFVRGFVTRYRDDVNEWEIWNEPLYQKIATCVYADFFIRTAEVIRSVQPEARIFGIASADVDVDSTTAFLEYMQKQNKLDLITTVTYHPYYPNPDESFPAVERLRAAIRRFSPDITLFQGECGAPSTNITYGALSGHEWSELTQAKWLLRRLLGDLGRDIRSSYFSIADMHYSSDGNLRMNTKGLLHTRADKTVDRVKMSYRALQHITALFDDSLQRLDMGPEMNVLSLFGYEKKEGTGVGKRIYTLWRPQEMPTKSLDMPAATVQLPATGLEHPVFIDLLSGIVYRIDKDLMERSGDEIVFKNMPVGDWPVAIAGGGLVSLKSE